jgi:hypothetical protein
VYPVQERTGDPTHASVETVYERTLERAADPRTEYLDASLDAAIATVVDRHGDAVVRRVIEDLRGNGYVAILTGRSRLTEDIDIVLEPLSEAELERPAERLDEEGYWGMAMPLDEMAKMLGGGDRLRVAEDGEMSPNFEVWLASNDLEREALSTSTTAEVGDHEVSISSIELQIAYKVRLAKGARTTDGKDFEDAPHLYLTFEDQFKLEQLKSYGKSRSPLTVPVVLASASSNCT